MMVGSSRGSRAGLLESDTEICGSSGSETDAEQDGMKIFYEWRMALKDERQVFWETKHLWI